MCEQDFEINGDNLVLSKNPVSTEVGPITAEIVYGEFGKVWTENGCYVLNDAEWRAFLELKTDGKRNITINGSAVKHHQPKIR